MMLSAGDQFDHFEILSHLAQGGIGDVYCALDNQSGCTVALKIPSKATLFDPIQYDYFLRELEAMRILQHPAVQHGLESGNYAGTPFLVTDLVAGNSLRHIIKHEHSLAIDHALALTRQIAVGIAYCHAQGVIHRDLKPENIIITEADQPIIIDFGLALLKTRPFPGKAAGTPEYMAPEQVTGGRADARIDIYAIGIILYEMITGSPPFEGDDPVEIMNKRLYEAAPRLDKIRPDVSASVATIAAKCLQHNPEMRYSDAESLIAALDHLDQVDVTELEILSTPPPKPGFFQTQPGQALMTTAAFVIGIVVLTVVLLLLKH